MPLPAGTAVAPLDLTGVQIPHHFRCPISLELMRDPVTVCTGQTYDRSSIESWVATGNTTCPVTRSPLPCPPALIPNHTLRRLIQQWCSTHHLQYYRSLLHRIPTTPPPRVLPPNPSLLRSLLSLSCSHSAPLPRRLDALRRLRLHLHLPDAKNHRHLLLPDLLRLALSPDSHPDLSLESLSLVSSLLPLPEADCRAVASSPDRPAQLSRLLRSPKSRATAAAVIEAVSAGTRSADLRVAIASAEGLVEGLVAMVREGDAAGVRALHAVCLERRNRERAVRAGAGEALVGAVAAGSMGRGEVERAVAAVEMLCRVEGGAEEAVGKGKEAEVVGALVGVMEGGATDRAAEHAAGALVVACAGRERERARREAVESGAVPLLLVMLQGGCSTERARRKAQALLKLLLEEGARVEGVSDEFLLLFPQPLKLQPQQQHQRRQQAAPVLAATP